ncbi:MAG: hypothetical protein AAFQ94_13380 [Bacteroidota bacterium]
MNTKVITSVIATTAVGLFAFFSSSPKKIVKSKAKTYKNKRTTPLDDANDDSYDLFI